jgi:hypothetical protein
MMTLAEVLIILHESLLGNYIEMSISVIQLQKSVHMGFPITA